MKKWSTEQCMRLADFCTIKWNILNTKYWSGFIVKRMYKVQISIRVAKNILMQQHELWIPGRAQMWWMVHTWNCKVPEGSGISRIRGATKISIILYRIVPIILQIGDLQIWIWLGVARNPAPRVWQRTGKSTNALLQPSSLIKSSTRKLKSTGDTQNE